MESVNKIFYYNNGASSHIFKEYFRIYIKNFKKHRYY